MAVATAHGAERFRYRGDLVNDRASRRPRVMYLATAMGVGGAEQQARYLARSLRRRGWDVMVVSMVPLENDEAELRAEGVVVRSLGMRPGIPGPRGMVRLIRLLREFRPDVLHSLMVHANLLARIVRPIARTPVVVSSIRTPNEGRQWRYVAYRMTNWLTDCTTAVSQDAIEVATARGAAPRDGIRLIGNGIDLDEYRPDPATRQRIRDELAIGDAFMWLAVGRMTAAKAYPDMVSAFAELLTSYPGARLLIAGSGESDVEGAVAARIATTGVGERLSLLGHRTDVADLMRASDGFLLSSAWEGLPMVLLEAAATELPIVATRVGGNEDAVDDGITGILVRSGDPAALADGMRMVMAKDEDARHAMGLAGRELVTHRFDLDAMIDVWVALYTELLNRKGSRRGAAGQPNRP